MAQEQKPLSRSEREARIKDKAGWVITVLAALLAITTYIASGYSGKVLTNTIAANNMYAFIRPKVSNKRWQNKAWMMQRLAAKRSR